MGDADRRQELQRAVNTRLEDTVARGWDALRHHVDEHEYEHVTMGDRGYTLESRVFWNDKRDGDLRVIVDIYEDPPAPLRALAIADTIVKGHSPTTAGDTKPIRDRLRSWALRRRAESRRER